MYIKNYHIVFETQEEAVQYYEMQLIEESMRMHEELMQRLSKM